MSETEKFTPPEIEGSTDQEQKDKSVKKGPISKISDRIREAVEKRSPEWGALEDFAKSKGYTLNLMSDR